MAVIKVERVLEDAIIPTRAHKSDAGYDLYTPVDFVVHGQAREIVDIGIRIALTDGYEGQIRGRSGIAAKKGVFVLNSPGTIDCFDENSYIKTVDGDKKIKNISIDDIVFSVDNNGDITKDTVVCIINTGIKCEVVTKAGSWFHYKDTKLGQGIDGAKTFLKENQPIEKEIKKEIIQAMDKENENSN